MVPIDAEGVPSVGKSAYEEDLARQEEMKQIEARRVEVNSREMLKAATPFTERAKIVNSGRPASLPGVDDKGMLRDLTLTRIKVESGGKVKSSLQPDICFGTPGDNFVSGIGLADGTLHGVEDDVRNNLTTIRTLSEPVGGEGKRYPLVTGIQKDSEVSMKAGDKVVYARSQGGAVVELADGRKLTIERFTLLPSDSQDKIESTLAELRATLEDRKTLVTGDPVFAEQK